MLRAADSFSPLFWVPPRETLSPLEDCLIALGGIWFAFVRNRVLGWFVLYRGVNSTCHTDSDFYHYNTEIFSAHPLKKSPILLLLCNRIMGVKTFLLGGCIDGISRGGLQGYPCVWWVKENLRMWVQLVYGVRKVLSLKGFSHVFFPWNARARDTTPLGRNLCRKVKGRSVDQRRDRSYCCYLWALSHAVPSVYTALPLHPPPKPLPLSFWASPTNGTWSWSGSILWSPRPGQVPLPGTSKTSWACLQHSTYHILRLSFCTRGCKLRCLRRPRR